MMSADLAAPVRIGRQPTQAQVAAVFAARMAASHGLATYLVWLAFTSQSAATAGWVLVARAVAALIVPLVVGHVHDRGSVGPWLRSCAVIEAAAAMNLAWMGWSGASGGWMIALSLIIGSTTALFDTVAFPLLLGARPSRLRPHVLVGLAYDVAKVLGSSVVLAMLVVWDSPVPVMAVSVLALAGWWLQPADGDRTEDADGALASPWRSMPLAPVVALSIVSVLTTQVSVFQVVAADDSFRRYALLGTAFAVGAVSGNLVLQRVHVTPRAVSASYLVAAFSTLLSMVAPLPAMVVYGAAMAGYYQLTRVLVVEASPPEARGRVAAAMTAITKFIAVGGSALGAALVTHRSTLYLTSTAIAVVAAAVVLWRPTVRR